MADIAKLNNGNNGNGEKKFFEKVKNYVWVVLLIGSFMFAISKYIIYTEPIFRNNNNISSQELLEVKASISDHEKRIIRMEEKYVSIKDDTSYIKADIVNIKDLIIKNLNKK